MQVKKEWVPMEEVVGSAVGRMEEQLGDRPSPSPAGCLGAAGPGADGAGAAEPPGQRPEVQPARHPHRDGGRGARPEARLSVSTMGQASPRRGAAGVREALPRRPSAAVPGAGPGPGHLPGHHPGPRRHHPAVNRPQGGARITLTLPIEGTPPELSPDGPS